MSSSKFSTCTTRLTHPALKALESMLDQSRYTLALFSHFSRKVDTIDIHGARVTFTFSFKEYQDCPDDVFFAWISSNLLKQIDNDSRHFDSDLDQQETVQL
ncbi:MAG: hypothetical protein GY906_36295 [bacterium]|nr:hypothetical protein [bacterium]